jgi:hypothetical protein
MIKSFPEEFNNVMFAALAVIFIKNKFHIQTNRNERKKRNYALRG